MRNWLYPVKMSIEPQNEPIWYILVFCIIFVGNRHCYVAKSRYLRNKLRIEGKGISPCKTRDTGQMQPKTVLSPKMNHIQLLKAFQVFEAFSPEIVKKQHYFIPN